MVKQTSLEDFKVYQDALALLVDIFKLLQSDKMKFEYSFSDQIKRSTLLISNNIAEGFERETDKELIRFLYFSKSSAGEVRNILNALRAVEYIDEDEYQKLREKVLDISKQLSNFIKFVVKRDREKGK